MANAVEKEALGLPSDASTEIVLEKIQALSQQAEEAKSLKKQLKEAGGEPDYSKFENRIKELVEQNEGLVKSTDELTNQNEDLLKQLKESGKAKGTSKTVDMNGEVPEGHVRTENGVEPLVQKRVKILAVTWDTLEPSYLKQGEFVQKEHRATRGDVIDIPESAAVRLSKPDISAFFDTIDPPTYENTEGDLQFSQMSEADLINWHRMNSPSAADVIDAAAGDPDVARRLVEAESIATGGDPREEVVLGLAEIIGRDS